MKKHMFNVTLMSAGQLYRFNLVRAYTHHEAKALAVRMIHDAQAVILSIVCVY